MIMVFLISEIHCLKKNVQKYIEERNILKMDFMQLLFSINSTF